ncbi:hypothetical protein CNBG3950 [Cryptococcus deneoformans B-3501A]|nr:hypothetical protein CNBG3950 [Cryptococcus neoformans var. neoformans B-3501A]EAL19448.1 hypothetical protein CNBG3950 [Cryptococcus neoformans var. neoformans B-3501A]
MENAVRRGAGAGGGKCHIARDEIALLGVLRRDGTGGSFRAGRALRNASHTHSPRSKRKSKSVQPNLSSPSLRSSSKSTRWEKNSSTMADVDMSSAPAQRSNLRYGMNKGRPTTVIPKTARPSNKKGLKTEKKTFVRSVIREVAGFSPYEKRVMELLRNSKDKKAKKLTKKRLGTLLRSKRKIEELSAVIVEQRRAGH